MEHIIQMCTYDNTGVTFPITVQPPLTVDRCRLAAMKKFTKGEMVKKSRGYNGVTGQEVTEPLSADFCPQHHIVWAGKKEWKGAERIAADFAARSCLHAIRSQQTSQLSSALSAGALSAEGEAAGCVDWVDSGEPICPEIISAARSQRDVGVVLCWKDTEKNG